jgi:hypothetical protein
MQRRHLFLEALVSGLALAFGVFESFDKAAQPPGAGRFYFEHD